jgi:gas vesicle protein
MIWYILGVSSIILLIIYSKNRNAVWGGLTAGVVIGLIVALFFLIKGSGFIWNIIVKGAIIGTIAGFTAELLGKIGDKLSKK